MELMQQQVRLGFRCLRDPARATIVGTVNTGVMIFATPIATFPATRVPVSDWCRVTTSDAGGSDFKMLRKGVYEFHMVLPVTLFETRVWLQMSLDSRFLTAGINTTSSITQYLDYDTCVTGPDPSLDTLKVSSTVHITNTLRGNSTYSVLSPATTSQVGTVRIHAAEGAGGTALQVGTVDLATLQLWCNGVAELFG